MWSNIINNNKEHQNHIRKYDEIIKKRNREVFRMESEKENKSKPVKNIKVGSIQLAIWQNKKDDKEWLTYSYSRSYKDEKDVWQNTTSLRTQDLPDLHRALELAFDFAKIESLSNKKE